ncbi:MAG TPA: hypothetical protein VKX17_14800 [Planctomycetota bacterium]|nr:hypothetical protein [Planctomycetota bacterium]
MISRVLCTVAVFALLVTAGCGGGSQPDMSNNRDVDAPQKKKEVAGGGGGDSTPSKPKGGGGGGEAYDAAKATGVVKGVVKFAGNAPTMLALPVPDPGCANHRKDANLPPLKDEKLEVNAQNQVANVFVFVSDGYQKYNFDNYKVPDQLIDQNGCQYRPHTFGLIAGQRLDIKSSDPVAHNIHCDPVNNQPFNISQPDKGIAATKPLFSTAEMDVKVKCDVHGWMNARICVFEHPFFAVTNEDGSYEIKLPPGEYTISAWQEMQTPYDNPKKWKYTMSDPVKVTVTADKPAEADFMYKSAK